MTRGEMWWVERPQLGRRPHLILTRETAIPVLRSVIAVPATRNVRGLPTEVLLGPDDGMPAECALTLDSTTLLPKALFVEPICQLGVERMDAVCKALAIATGCR